MRTTGDGESIRTALIAMAPALLAAAPRAASRAIRQRQRTPWALASALTLAAALAVTLVPLRESSIGDGARCVAWAPAHPLEYVANLLLFAPFACFALAATRSRLAIAGVGICVPLAVELTQSQLAGRTCDASDWALNALGVSVVVGVFSWKPLGAVRRRREAVRPPRRRPRP